MAGSRWIAKDVEYTVSGKVAKVSRFRQIESVDGKVVDKGTTEYTRDRVGEAINNGIRRR
jgi:hypothetical protein